MSKCPICSTETSNKIQSSPYWLCHSCGCGFQDPMPAKVYEAAHEKDEDGGFRGHLMSQYEKEINDALAHSIVHNFMGKPGKTLDVGAKYPYLAHCFNKYGCEAFAMDNIEIVPEYSKELNVPMLMADFEALTEEQIKEWTKTDKFQCITMIHMFEHLYNPLEALRKMRHLLADDGILFLRLPQHDVSGYERDLTEGHYTIHPFFHSFPSILELLVQAKDLFSISWHSPMEGAGQRDIVLKPLTKKPLVYCGMIVKNEERDLPKCLSSIKDVVDKVFIIDTGSTDNTALAAAKCWSHTKKPMVYETYTEASKQDESGDWKLWDFGKARNRFVELIENSPEADYLIWMDADDVLLTPNNLKRAFYLSSHNVFGLTMNDGGLNWVHHRAWKTKLGIKFDGKIHEYPVLGDNATFTLTDTIIRHDAAPGVGESSNLRNLRILEGDFAEDPHNTRTLFYLANTHKDAARYLEAVKYYALRINEGMAYRDEWLFSYLYKARCERAAGLIEESKVTLLQALDQAPTWSEFWCELAYIEYNRQDYEACIKYCIKALENEQEYTQLWREPNKYTDQPCRLMSFCYETAGSFNLAHKWAVKAMDFIPTEDKEWKQRIQYLSNKVKKTPKFAINRPGAIGDILMILNCIPELKAKYPEYEIDFYTKTTGLEHIMKIAGVDNVFNSDDLWEKGTEYEKIFNLIGYPIKSEGYPNNPMSKHLIQYFAEELGLNSVIHKLKLDLPAVINEPYITIHPFTGWSVYKEWGVDKWEDVIQQFPDTKFIQIGTKNDVKLAGCDHTFMTSPLEISMRLIANAKLHLGGDSFSNHLTHMTDTPAIILWGSTQKTASGYEKNTNISLGLSCQPCFKENPSISNMTNGVCNNPEGQTYENPQHACMAGISVVQVCSEISKQLLS